MRVHSAHSSRRTLLYNKLQLQATNHENISVSSFGAQLSAVKRLAVATIHLYTLNGVKIPESVLVIPELVAPVHNSISAHLCQLPYLHHLPLAHPVTSDDNFRVSIFIGADYYWHFVQDRLVRRIGPTAVESRLGYLLSGPLPLVNTSCVQITRLSCITDIDYNTFWEVESMGTTTPRQNQDAEFLQTYLSTKVSTQPDGSYCLKFPWKDNHPPLPYNYNICARRTRSMAHRLAKTPTLLRIYSTIIEDQERREFIEKVDSNLEHTTSAVHYIYTTPSC